MLSDLGLHEHASIFGGSNDAHQSTKDIDSAYALVSACVVYEGVWALYLGRPSSIPRSVMNIVAARCKAEQNSNTPWLDAWVGLCVPMAEISQVLNEQSLSDSEKSASLRRLFRQTEEWHESLPPELTYDDVHAANMDLAGYGLHAQYYKVQILLRQALSRLHRTSKKRRYSQLAAEGSPETSCDDPNAIIYQYAVRIARLVVTCREAFGAEKIPSIMLDNAVLAATVMIDHLKRPDRLNEMQDQMWAKELFRSLETVQPHFPIIGRMLDSLKQIHGVGHVSKLQRSATQNSSTAFVPALPGLGKSPDFSFRPQIVQENPFGVGGQSFPAWEFDTDTALLGFDDYGLSLTPSKELNSGMARSIV